MSVRASSGFIERFLSRYSPAIILITFITLLLMLSIYPASAGTFADAQLSASRINTALAQVTPYDRSLTPAQMSTLGINVANLSRPTCTYRVLIKSASYDSTHGTLDLYMNAWACGNELHIKNPVHWYMPMVLSGTTNNQRLNTFARMLISFLDNQEFGTAENDDSAVVYPTVDGEVISETSGSYSTIRGDDGDIVQAGITQGYQPYLHHTTTENVYDEMRRGVASFNTSFLGATTTIDSALVSLKYYWASGTGKMGITDGVLASNTSLAAGDYDGFGSNEFVARVNFEDNTNRHNLTVTDLTLISKTSYTIMFFRDENDITNTPPTWASDYIAAQGWYFVDHATENYRPYLYIEYTPGAVAPTCTFSADDVDVCTTQSVQFTDSSSNTPTDWDWDVDHNVNHGKDYDTQNPSHTYGSSGTYDVELYCANAGGSDTELKASYISVDAPPVANFYANDTSVCPNEMINFTSNSTNAEQWDWLFEDSTDCHTEQCNKYFDTPGTYWVNLTADNSGCASDSENKTAYITVNDCSPVAAFSANDTSVLVGECVGFTDLSTNGPTGWNWSADGVPFSTDQNPAWCCAAAGDYTILLNASNDYGWDEEEKIDYIECTAIPPTPVVASFTDNLTGSCGDEPLWVGFTDTSTGGPDTWYWDFGDGNTSNDQNPTNIFTAGTWTVRFNATNSTSGLNDWNNETTITVPCPQVVEVTAGETWISWTFAWLAGTNSSLVVDGVPYGYTPAGYFILTGLNPSEEHRLAVYNASDDTELWAYSEASTTMPTATLILLVGVSAALLVIALFTASAWLSVIFAVSSTVVAFPMSVITTNYSVMLSYLLAGIGVIALINILWRFYDMYTKRFV